MIGNGSVLLLVTSVALVTAHATVSAQGQGIDIERYLQDSIDLDARQIADVRRGRAVSKILPTKSPEDVTVFGVVTVHSTRAAFVARLADPARVLALRHARFGIIGDSVTAADLGGISVAESEARDLRECKVNECNFKLSAPMMRQFAESVDWNSSAAKGQVDSLLRVDVMRLIASYRASGSAGMVRYDDSGGRPSSEAFEALLAQSPSLPGFASELRDYLTAYPAHRPDGARDIIYWSEDKIARLRATITVNHLVVYTPPSGPPLVARKQIYATHYFEGAFELMTALDAPSLSTPPTIYLVSVRRYRFDHLPSGGFLNIRGRVRDQLAKLMRSDLDKERKALEGGS